MVTAVAIISILIFVCLAFYAYFLYLTRGSGARQLRRVKRHPSPKAPGASRSEPNRLPT